VTTCNHCLGRGCIHCREHQAELAGQQRRSRLTEADREALGLFARLRPKRPKPARPASPVHGAHPMVSVLPADFTWKKGPTMNSN
jgi:hypothetical protein